MVGSGMFPKAEMRATAADAGKNSGKILHRDRYCFTQSKYLEWIRFYYYF